jgi:hypothetical protein
MYKILISNVRFFHENLSEKVGTILNAGTFLARPERNGDCHPYISVTVQEYNILDDDNDEYRYIDPSSFLLKRFPTPKWTQHCNDFTQEQKGHVVKEGDASAHPKSEETTVMRDGSGETITSEISGKQWGNISFINSTKTDSNSSETEIHLNRIFDRLSTDLIDLNIRYTCIMIT